MRATVKKYIDSLTGDKKKIATAVFKNDMVSSTIKLNDFKKILKNSSLIDVNQLNTELKKVNEKRAENDKTELKTYEYLANKIRTKDLSFHVMGLINGATKFVNPRNGDGELIQNVSIRENLNNLPAFQRKLWKPVYKMTTKNGEIVPTNQIEAYTRDFPVVSSTPFRTDSYSTITYDFQDRTNITALRKLFSFFDGDYTGDELPLNTDEIIIVPTAETVIPINTKKQTFKDNIETSTCLLDAIENVARIRIKNPEYLNATMNTIRKLKNEYPNGVHYNEINDIASKVNCRIWLTDIFCENKQDFKPTNKPRFSVNLINSRFNHVDNISEISIIDTKVPTVIPEQKFNEIYTNLRKSKEAFIYRGSINKPMSIKYNGGYITSKTEKSIMYDNYLSESNLQYCKVKLDSPYYNIIRNGACYTGNCIFNYANDNDIMREFDMKKAYNQYKLCPFYEKFMVTPKFNMKCNGSLPENAVGYFYVQIKSIKANENVSKFLSKLGIFTNSYYCFFSAEIRFLSQFINFNVICGVWNDGSEILDLPTENKFYSYATGRFGMESSTIDSFLHTDDTFAQVLIGNTKGKFFKVGRNTFQFTNTETVSKNLKHIAGAITAYCRINLYTELFNLDFNDVIGYKLDSIIVRNGITINNPLFVEKKCNYNIAWCNNVFKPINNDRDEIFINEFIDVDAFPEFDSEIIRPTVILGAGGCGKTHWLLKDKIGCFAQNYTTYSSFAWKLSSEIFNKYNVIATTNERLIGGPNTTKFQEIYKFMPSVIVIDEITMLSHNAFKTIQKNYPTAIFFLLGDFELSNKTYIPMQCTIEKDDAVLNISKLTNFAIKKFTIDRRATCQKLRDLKKSIRDIMVNGGDIISLIKKNLPQFNHDQNNFDVMDDIIITSTNKQIQEITSKYNYDIYKCYDHDNNTLRLRIKTGDKSYVLTGEIVRGKKPEVGKFVKQSAFTSHSLQGLDFDGKIIIDITKVFQKEILYTAISRAKRFEQLYIL